MFLLGFFEYNSLNFLGGAPLSQASRIEQYLKEDLWTTDLASIRGLHRVGVRMLRLAIAVAGEFRHRVLDARAAGLVFTTLLSLVPFLAVTFSVLKGFGVHQQIEPVLAQALEPLGPKGQEITDQIIGFVSNLKVGVLGVVGIAGLFYTTYSLIGKIEQAQNAIWRVRSGRSLARQFTDYLSVVLVGPLLVVTAFGLLAAVQSHSLVQRVLEFQPLGYVVVWSARFIPFLVLCGVFTFLYKFVPYTTVRFGSALVGGISAAVLWGMAGKGFALFVASSAKYSAIYSSFAILILFLLWLYVGWMIILIGSQVAFFHQHPSAYDPRVLWRQGTHAFRERTALTLLLHVTRRYLNAGRPYRMEELAAELKLPISIIEELVEELVEEAILATLTEPEGIALIKPPELVPVQEIVEAVRERGVSKKFIRVEMDDPVGRVLSRRNQAVERALAGMTLRSLAQETATLPETTTMSPVLLEETAKP